MKRLILTGLVMLMGPFAYAGVLTDLTDGSKEYFLSSVTVGWYDHYHGGHDEPVAKEKNVLLSIPTLAYNGLGMDVFTTFEGRKVEEWGARFNLSGLSEYGFMKHFRFEPYVFKNEAVDAVGFGIFAQVRLK